MLLLPDPFLPTRNVNCEKSIEADAILLKLLRISLFSIQSSSLA